MVNKSLLIAIFVVMLGVMVFAVALTVEKSKLPKDKKHNIYVKFNGKDRDIPKDGQLLLIKQSLEDTVVVEPATLDDCRRILEEHGQG